MSKKIIIGSSVFLVLIISIFFFSGNNSEQVLLTKARIDNLNINVSTTGELEAKNFVEIQGPLGMRQAQIWETKINSLVPEGTVVEKGQQVARLDASSLGDKLEQKGTDLTKAESQWEQTQLDTALQLSLERDKIINLEFTVQEKKLALEQSAFEPPATIKQAEIEVIKAERDLRQTKQNYLVKQKQLSAKMREVNANLSQAKSKVKFLEDLFQEFTIVAPESGMVIYAKDWDGKKKKEGSNIRAWDPVVATLPDLSVMISKTYVNEVDIRKIKKGQTVSIGLDAFPDKNLTGEVTKVANVGEQKPNSDAKVFEVVILVNQSDSTLRPSMTTSNIIQTGSKENVLLIPIEALHTEGDSINFVYKKTVGGFEKQEVKTGLMNDQDIEILTGLSEGEEISLTTPESSSSNIASVE
ncbi:HlyD family efflux transporter periplasmic adaptor subunit [Flammeovirga yaeyamensis]|uniref:HlyD family efflux transporter periplasmic adaptor subunit n=1 Tax=Flammeovirga yaeyamensis TaxID=367791 RepID=A0AAX1N0D1_9BACT|nr:HlyD family efflux transporter periplasmic adaptor subunit [Flammeovirga yaeyamensis]MBB3700115.1 multidrug efflux pump subunit AcrA (membrane-fusion protein) [Flammeovirga yaeyamensis]NMF37254.1 HlyD family efflux transporter periplasmic adaptor subunit [Flammeovirga yaeyamensis]QWG00942.1 HlyD family efflux transporter periplasmic adaptor subunit [Flammeovirga yaeyamensis]